jgi:PAS domain S-box-containing protein
MTGMPDERVGAAEQRLAAIVDSSDDAIVAKDLSGVITSWNPAAERMFGYTAAEAVGSHITLVIPPETSAEEVRKRIRRGEAVERFETTCQRKDGSRFTVWLTLSPVRDAGGAVAGASIIARDITDRAIAEARLAEARAAQADLQRRLLTLVAASGTLLGTPRIEATVEGAIALARELVDADAYAIWRFEPYAMEWRTIASFGLSSEFVADVTIRQGELRDFPYPDPLVIDNLEQMPMIERRREAYRREGVNALLIVPLFIRGRATATMVFYSKHRHKFTGVELETSRALGNLAASGITTAELYEEQRRSREQADFMVEIGSALASSLDYHQTMRTLVGLAVPRIADWCAVDMLGASGALERLAVEHANPQRIDLVRAVHERYGDPESPYDEETVIRTGRPVILPHVSDAMIAAAARGDEELLHKLRGLGIVSYMCVPLSVQDRSVGAITFVSTGRRFGEADLRFAEQIALRAGLAVENALAYADAREASRLKDEFLATLSHELRTPLNTLLGYARMLQSGVIPPDRQTRAVDIVERNATSLSQIVADVLDVSRIISGKLRFDLQPVDVGPVIREAMETVRPAADAKHIRIVLTLESLENTVGGDPARLQQVLWNLLSNAVKFTQAGGRIDIRVRHGDTTIDVEVADTGIGIAPDFLPYVFDRFRQADSRFSREHGGLGLGLAIARHIVEMHGGRIDAMSEGTGRGATFRVSLPRLMPKHDADVVERSTVGGAPWRRLSGLRVLAVDDQEDTLAMLRDILEAAGAQVTTASGADEAIRLIESQPPDVLLADIGLPGVDGLELIRRIRHSSVPEAQHVPAAALTAYVRAEDSAAALESGYHLHVPKPVDPNEVVRIVGSLAGRSS